ncbi:MAG: hypothetical protein LBS74_10775 [Oscillospiraceae bacterium]|jgi:MraZ protein|nr:hypothetical protein [Oscillospiraceae bacterium]
MLTGRFPHSIDASGRIVVPSKLRDDLGELVYFTLSTSRPGIEGFTAAAYEKLAGGYRDYYEEFPDEADFFFENTFAVTIDKQGRALLPQQLRQDANLKENIITVGQFDKILIKNAEDAAKPVSSERRKEVSILINARIRESGN